MFLNVKGEFELAGINQAFEFFEEIVEGVEGRGGVVLGGHEFSR